MLDPDIRDLDLDPIAFKLCLDEGFGIEAVDTAVLQYRCFLQIIRDAEPGFCAAPSRTVDTVWHHHILDTEKYHADCEALFGRYLHHFPYSGIFEGEDAQKQEQRHEQTTRRMNLFIAAKGPLS